MTFMGNELLSYCSSSLSVTERGGSRGAAEAAEYGEGFGGGGGGGGGASAAAKTKQLGAMSCTQRKNWYRQRGKRR